MSRLTRDGTAEPVSRGDRILRRERGQGNIIFSLFSWPRAGLATLPGWSILLLLSVSRCCCWWFTRSAYCPCNWRNYGDTTSQPYIDLSNANPAFLWSQRGTKVNGSHHGDNPLLRPTGIQIATKSYATLQAMAPTNIKTVRQTSLLHIIKSNLDRLGLLSPTHDQRSQQQTRQITLQPVLINKSKFLKATHCWKIRKLKYRGPLWWRPWAGGAGARASIQPSKALCIPEETPRILPVRRSLWPS